MRQSPKSIEPLPQGERSYRSERQSEKKSASVREFLKKPGKDLFIVRCWAGTKLALSCCDRMLWVACGYWIEGVNGFSVGVIFLLHAIKIIRAVRFRMNLAMLFYVRERDAVQALAQGEEMASLGVNHSSDNA